MYNVRRIPTKSKDKDLETKTSQMTSLIDNALSILPVSRNTLGSFVVPSETMDTALDKNEAELGVLILTVPVEMLTNGDGLLNKHVQVLWELRGKTLRLENAQNLVSSHRAHLGNALGITKINTNLRGYQTLLRELADLVGDLIGRGL